MTIDICSLLVKVRNQAILVTLVFQMVKSSHSVRIKHEISMFPLCCTNNQSNHLNYLSKKKKHSLTRLQLTLPHPPE